LIRFKAFRYKERSGTVVRDAGRDGARTNDELLTMKCDILVPAALENVITLQNAESDQGPHRGRSFQWTNHPRMRMKFLARRGINRGCRIFLANAGGVTAQLFRMGAETSRVPYGKPKK